MKVKYSQEIKKTRISELVTGDTFLAKRPQSSKEDVYIIINMSGYDDSKIAVNLTGGQVRSFKNNTQVTVVKTEIKVLKWG